MPSIGTLTNMAVGGLVVFAQPGGQPSGASTPFDANALSLQPLHAATGFMPHGVLQPLSSLPEPDPESAADHLRDQAGEGANAANHSFLPGPFTSYLGINVTDTRGETITYIVGDQAAGCGPSVNGTFVGNGISRTTTTADCDDDPNATVALISFGNHTYLGRLGPQTFAESIYSCTNITGHDGPEPPHLITIHAFAIDSNCTPSTTDQPTPASGVPQPPTKFPWEKAVGFGAGLLAIGSVAACYGARKHCAQGRQVAPIQPPAQEHQLETEMVAINRPGRDDAGERPLRVITSSSD